MKNVLGTLQRFSRPVQGWQQGEYGQPLYRTGDSVEDVIILQDFYASLDLKSQSTIKNSDSTYEQLKSEAKLIFGERELFSTSSNEVFLHPFSGLRAVWDVTFMLFLAFVAFVYPPLIGFRVEQISIALKTILGLVSVVFLTDVYLNFQTGCMKGKTLVMNRNEVTSHYLKGRFTYDMISSLPFEIAVLVYSNNADTVPSIFLALRFITKVPSLVRVSKSLKCWEEILLVSPNLAILFRLFFLGFLYLNTMVCIKILLGFLQGDAPDGWMYVAGVQDASAFVQYSWCLFEVVSEAFTGGYNSYSPLSTIDIWFGFFGLSIGSSCYTILLGLSTTLILSLTLTSCQYMETIEQWRDFGSYHKVDKEVQRRCIAQLQYDHFPGQCLEEEKMLRNLPSSLAADVAMSLITFHLNRSPIFLALKDNSRKQLMLAMTRSRFGTGELLVRFHEPLRCLYFVSKGTVKVERMSGSVRHFQSSSTFGEDLFLGPGCVRYIRSAVALENTEVYILTREAAEEFPELMAELSVMLRVLARSVSSLASTPRTSQVSNQMYTPPKKSKQQSSRFASTVQAGAAPDV